jgi:hypothetical protein
MRRRKGTDFDVSMCSLLALWMSMKELPELFQGRRLQTSLKGFVDMGSTSTPTILLMTCGST